MLKLELNGKMLSMVWKEYKRCGQEKEMDEIENKLLKVGFDECDKISNELFENLAYFYYYRCVLNKYKNEEWFEDFCEIDETDTKLQRFVSKIGLKDSKFMKKEIRSFTRHTIENYKRNLK